MKIKGNLPLILVFLLAITSIVITVVLAFGRGETQPPLMTFEEVGQNYGEFYSLVYDRSDVTEGSFTLSPGEGDRFRVVSNDAPYLVLEATTETKKTLSRSGLRLEIDTEQVYWLSAAGARTEVTVPIRIAGFRGEEEMLVTLAFTPIFSLSSPGSTGYIDEELFKKLKGLGNGPYMLDLEVVSSLRLDDLVKHISLVGVDNDDSVFVPIFVLVKRIDGIKIEIQDR